MSPKEIAEKRRSLNISQDKLSEKLGVDPTTVYRWEAGVVAPNLANTQRLIEIFSRSEVTLSHFDNLLLEQNTPVAIIDLSCTYLAANIKFSNLIGQSKDEIVDLHIRELFSKMLRVITHPPFSVGFGAAISGDSGENCVDRGLSTEFLCIDDGSDGAIALCGPHGTESVCDLALYDRRTKGPLTAIVGDVDFAGKIEKRK